MDMATCFARISSAPLLKTALLLFCSLFGTTVLLARENGVSPIPANSRQMILVVTPDAQATNGRMFLFERVEGNPQWSMIKDSVPVVVGRKGLAWGRGLSEDDPGQLPEKKEGDGKSPAGVFKLGAAFGYAPVENLGPLNIPYMHVTNQLECVDDVHSAYYNELVRRDEVKKVDWASSEKMRAVGQEYELGVLVEHNTEGPEKGAGSCIFLHIWGGPESTTSGCTAMAAAKMQDVVHWLDASRHPVLVQLTLELFQKFRTSWQLPAIPR